MAFASVIIDKTFGGTGESWSNTYAINLGAFQSEPITAGQLVGMIGATDPFTDANTNPNDAGYTGGLGAIVHSIVGFERLLHDTTVNISRIYISDGRESANGLSNTVFYSQNVNFACLNTLANLDPVAGSVVLLVNKAVEVGQRNGRGYYRGVLGLTEVKLDNNAYLVNYASTAVRTAVEARFNLALVNSSLLNYFRNGSLATSNQVTLCVPRVWTKKQVEADPTQNEGDIRNVSQVVAMTVVGPRSRQVGKNK